MVDLRKEAIRQRVEYRKSAREISKMLGVCPSTVIKWVRGYPLTEAELKIRYSHRSTKLRDLLGQRFGKLVVIGRGANRVTSGGNIMTCWIVKCDCGIEKSVKAGSLVTGNTTSCGCNRGKPEYLGNSLRNYVLRAYKVSADKRKLEWQLTDSQFDHLTSSNCHYCFVGPYTKLVKRGHNGEFIYNGIDRVDNKQGYLYENVVPCCKPCNYAKGKMAYKDFQAWINRIRAQTAVS